MKILALEPYYGGSHKAFLDGWIKRSRHTWTLFTQPPYAWKWRMRSSAIIFADQARNLIKEGQTWDIFFCSDMLNLAEFLGLIGSSLPPALSVAYFHENQLTYPNRFESERDLHFTMINMSTTLVADKVWFNSAFHRDEFLSALENFLCRMPGRDPAQVPQRIRNKAEVFPPGIELSIKRLNRKPGPLHILWAARWDHDKNPEDFFEVLKIIKQRGVGFRLSVIGEQFRNSSPIFDWAKQYFSENICHWGYQEHRSDYEAVLAEADVIVSTARHEFFGISILEAMSAGAYPLLPKRLSYPELLESIAADGGAEFLYDGSVEGLAEKLLRLATSTETGSVWKKGERQGARVLERFSWNRKAYEMDGALEKISGSNQL